VDEVLITLVRAAYLLRFAAAPSAVTPEPLPPASPALAALLSLLGLAGLIAAALWLERQRRTRLALAAAIALGVAVLAAIAGALRYSGVHAPLGRGVFFVAVPLWLGLALAAIAVAGRRRRSVLAGALVAALGLALHVDAAPVTTAPAAMWWEALRRDGRHERALMALAGPHLRARRHLEAARVADRCAALAPTSCACPRLRAEVELAAHELDAALADAGRAVRLCPDRGAPHAVVAKILALRGDLDGAEREVELGLALGDPAALHLARAVILERRGRYDDARAEVGRAIAAGAGRDAELLAAALAIVAGDLDDARRRLEPLVAADPDDVEATYDLALVADHRDDYNRARQGYLAVLARDPHHASARYNLAMLAWRNGATEEARHHARRFVEAFPADPRTTRLQPLVR